MNKTTITLYRFRLRDGAGKLRNAPCMMTEQDARERYGEGNYEVVPGSEEVRRNLGQTGDIMNLRKT